MARNAYSVLVKILLIGDTRAGKTSLIQRYLSGTFREEYVQTIGIDFGIKSVEIDGEMAKVQLWDTAGPERFRMVTCTYYRHCHCVCIVYDVTDQISFDHVKNWMNEVESHAEPDVRILLVGNKCDRAEDRKVDTQTAQEFAEKHGLEYIETSCKDDTNVSEMFLKMVREFVKTKTLDRLSQSPSEPSKKKSGLCHIL